MSKSSRIRFAACFHVTREALSAFREVSPTATQMEAVVKYVLFNLINGQGEKGLASVIVNSDGSGNAGRNFA
jgi:hypothetical protein